MAGGSVSVDALLADAVSKLDSLSKRMDAYEAGEGHKNPLKADSAKADDDDDDKRKDDGITANKTKILDSKKADDDDDDDKRKDSKRSDDDDDDDKKRKDSKKADKAKADDDDDKRRDDDDDDDDKKRKDSKKADKAKADDDDDDDKKRGDDGELELKHKGGGELKEDKRKDSKKADRLNPHQARHDDDDDDKRKDSRADAVSPDLLARLARLERVVRPMTDEEHEQFADAQARADAVYNGFGKRAPRPLEGEGIVDYRTRLANNLKLYSKTWSKAKLSRLPIETFEIAEGQIYADAAEAARHPVDLDEGELRAVTSVDQNTGLRTTKFYGKESFIKGLGRPGRRVTRIRTDRLAS